MGTKKKKKKSGFKERKREKNLALIWNLRALKEVGKCFFEKADDLVYEKLSVEEESDRSKEMKICAATT